VAGTDGMIYKTINSGDTWTKLVSGSGTTLHTLTFTSVNYGYAAGDTGIILKTTNGSTWTRLTSGTKNSLRGSSFPTSAIGYVVGDNGTILKTTNSGTTWNIIETTSPSNFYSVAFSDEYTGFVVGDNNTILKTTDGGENWTLCEGSFWGTFKYVSISTGEITVVGDLGIILRSSDEGTTWKKYTNSNVSNTLYYIFQSSDEYIVGTNGYLGIRGDYGYFGTVTTDISNNIYSCATTTNNVLCYVGSNGMIRRINSAENTWTEQTSGTTINLNRITCNNLGYTYVVGDSGMLMYSYDKGKIWNRSRYSDLANLTSISSDDDNNNYVTGGNYLIRNYTFRNNLGDKFYANKINEAKDTLSSVYCSTTSDNAIAVGKKGTIYKFRPSVYYYWDSIPSNTCNNLNDVYFTDSLTGFACGDLGTILKTKDKGNTWTYLPAFTTTDMSRVFFVDTLVGFVTGKGEVYKTTNGGYTWKAISLPNYIYRSIYFKNDLTGYVVGENGQIYYTGDGGSSWILKEYFVEGKSLYQGDFNDVIISKDNEVFVVGDTGVIIKQNTSLPKTPATINGSGNNCVESSATFSIAPVTNASYYDWRFPKGVSGSSNSNSITLYFSDSAQSGPISVRGINELGAGDRSVLNVNIKKRSTTPILTYENGLITSDVQSGLSWYYNDTIVPDYDLYQYAPQKAGKYYVISSANGCPSLPSESVSFSTKSNLITELKPTLFPNPGNGKIYIENFSNTSNEDILIEIYNVVGNKIQSLSHKDFTSGTYIDLTNFSNGVYYVKVKHGTYQYIWKYMKTL
jgi:photosystem II stability/assembly factor-like uncharacterized protein